MPNFPQASSAQSSAAHQVHKNEIEMEWKHLQLSVHGLAGKKAIRDRIPSSPVDNYIGAGR